MKTKTSTRNLCGTVAVLCAVLTLAPRADAGVVAPDLEAKLAVSRPTDNLAVIMTFADRLDLAAYQSKGRGTDAARTSMLKALHDKAAATQKNATAILASSGVKKSVSLWLINGMSFTAPAWVVRLLPVLPGVDTIRLDATLGVPQPLAGTSVRARVEPGDGESARDVVARLHRERRRRGRNGHRRRHRSPGPRREFPRGQQQLVRPERRASVAVRRQRPRDPDAGDHRGRQRGRHRHRHGPRREVDRGQDLQRCRRGFAVRHPPGVPVAPRPRRRPGHRRRPRRRQQLVGVPQLPQPVLPGVRAGHRGPPIRQHRGRLCRRKQRTGHAVEREPGGQPRFAGGRRGGPDEHRRQLLQPRSERVRRQRLPRGCRTRRQHPCRRPDVRRRHPQLVRVRQRHLVCRAARGRCVRPPPLGPPRRHGRDARAGDRERRRGPGRRRGRRRLRLWPPRRDGRRRPAELRRPGGGGRCLHDGGRHPPRRRGARGARQRHRHEPQLHDRRGRQPRNGRHRARRLVHLRAGGQLPRQRRLRLHRQRRQSAEQRRDRPSHGHTGQRRAGRGRRRLRGHGRDSPDGGGPWRPRQRRRHRRRPAQRRPDFGAVARLLVLAQRQRVVLLHRGDRVLRDGRFLLQGDRRRGRQQRRHRRDRRDRAGQHGAGGDRRRLRRHRGDASPRGGARRARQRHRRRRQPAHRRPRRRAGARGLVQPQRRRLVRLHRRGRLLGTGCLHLPGQRRDRQQQRRHGEARP